MSINNLPSIVITDHLNQDQKDRVEKLELLFGRAREDIETMLRTKAEERADQGGFKNTEIKEVVRQFLELAPIKILKVDQINEDEEFADQMLRMNTLKQTNSISNIKSIVSGAVSLHLE